MLSEKFIKENSKIYGCQGNRRLSKYENEINRSSMNLCLETPSLLSDLKTLLEKSKQVIDANGIVYKKGKSRSHKLNPSPHSDAKRIKLNKEFHLSRIEEINEKVRHNRPDWIQLTTCIIISSVINLQNKYLH